MKNQQMLQKIVQKSGRYLKNHSPTILSCIGVAGVVLTAAMAVKATPKALSIITQEQERRKYEDEAEDCDLLSKKDVVKLTWTYYVPAAVVGLSTIACILGANVLNRKQQAALTSAYALLSNSYKDYKDKVRELYGEDAHNNIINSLCVEQSKKNFNIYAQTFWGNMCLDFQDAKEEERLFYDSISKRYFESTISRVLQAEYHLNRNLMFNGIVSLNDFYELLGLEPTEFGDSVGWSTCNGDMYWLDFNHVKAELDDGLECYIIETLFEPDAESMQDL